ncbi:hypothetical protein A3B45_00840 [Candidatus Daviesbacteria bacterium RIFCSPLOWO2_01_FULL_39_12]|uniref:DUF5667 domain-containing protein n=1 Tax=Candidatus Daviesbacteria bacterium RIFCSPLOWO2_01_FULL_39_12 TaxID=1797785 RepID=A0A1F5KQY7_9BACT|nr:MAG: hypothetical protein A3D79_03760 [Candidatus Daviesbacteria bacterium RIFCSPHIGHO2_02_FULL_39_8]OGE43254.1 MAG: hypothetical protein A3B45_00840 [Candidatus Daviesbacteria bacterium RIFCSPLOWO2_01_FULL_39_12]
MKIIIVLTSVVLFGVIFLIPYNQVLALSVDQIDNYVGASIIHPAHPLYFLKTIRENFELKFAANPKTAVIRKIEFLTRRIREVKSLMHYQRPDLISSTLEKYAKILDDISGMDTQKRDVVNMAQDEVANHLVILIKRYTQLENNRAKISFRRTISRISQWNIEMTKRLNTGGYTDLAKKQIQLNLPACQFLSKEASSSALNDVERVVLKKRADKCFIYYNVRQIYN